jgi:hypothetical protein
LQRNILAEKIKKSSGFNIEDTYLTDLKPIEKLFSIVMVVFAWACVVGILKISHTNQSRFYVIRSGFLTFKQTLFLPHSRLPSKLA